ncbi:thioredoxin-like protein [Coccomyxa subellipsoidea C-169]|uniref:Thioredoxin-like protein n=1 Tax=Coccomyxa subellipsoidea (strain C-169) TaxID=574566 RepID=I0YZB1_COCSC|nr:thioredoxin-like protein [Coccomyxa subellipsoidea C-169]EIE23730.1 thioredoxin-like protein [Coccomyxa subellipsoidea C-169]|eukprot:XP_005648274.1 thioredoxin-like protein [Coccomyxa subellipsoidea C-169]
MQSLVHCRSAPSAQSIYRAAPPQKIRCTHIASAKSTFFSHRSGQLRSSRPSLLRRSATPTSTISGKVDKLTAEELEVVLQERTKPLIIDFYATWCGPCLLLAKELEQVAEELGDTVRIVKIDTDEHPEVSSQLQIQGLPTMVFVGTDPNKPALRTEGLLPAHVIKEIVQNELLASEAEAAA